jgi:hypothetical protein
MTPVHFYHLFVGTDATHAHWLPVVADHVAALRDSGFAGDCYVGLVGNLENRRDAELWLSVNWPGAVIDFEANEGFEHLTLEGVRSWASVRAIREPETPVFYAHNKGSFSVSLENDAWRKDMTARLLENDHWIEHSFALTVDHADVVACHWLTPEEFLFEGITTPIAAGNFWWARAGYLASLPRVETKTRYQSEAWVGLNHPRVLALQTAWPPLAPANFGAFGTSVRTFEESQGVNLEPVQGTGGDGSSIVFRMKKRRDES